MAIEKYTAVNNIKSVIENEAELDAHVDVDLGIAAAYIESERADANKEAVDKELEELAKGITPDPVEEPETSVDNVYTKKLTLSEGIEEFISPEFKAALEADTGKEDDDKFLSFDMFEFIYSFVTDVDTETQALITKKLDTLDSYKALVAKKQAMSSVDQEDSHKDSSLKKFRGTGYDNYRDNESDPEATQVSASVNSDAITIYGQTADRFDWVKEICDMYQLKYAGPVESPYSNAHWRFAFTIYVPMAAPGTPMMVSDYFEDIGIPLEEVMPEKFVDAYRKRQARERKEMKQMLNDTKVEKIFDKWVKEAGRSNDPLDAFINNMFAELAETTFDFDDEVDVPLQFSRSKLKKKFLDKFNDDFEDDEE